MKEEKLNDFLKSVNEKRYYYIQKYNKKPIYLVINYETFDVLKYNFLFRLGILHDDMSFELHGMQILIDNTLSFMNFKVVGE